MKGSLALLGARPRFTQDGIPPDRATISPAGMDAVVGALQSGRWSMFTSPEVPSFEAEFAAFVGAKHAVFVNSCTTAILAALNVLGITHGDLVGVPAYTYIGTCLPLLELGAKPVWIDISEDSQNLDAASLRGRLEQRQLSAVVIPLLFGDARGIQAIVDLCVAKGVPMVFDCAQFLGDQAITTKLSECGLCCFSFGESKILRLGEGGAVTTSSQDYAEAVRRYRHEGESWLSKGASRVSLSEVSPLDVMNSLASAHRGLNLRPLACTAALGRVQLQELDGFLDSTRKNAKTLKECLASAQGIALPTDRLVWWTFPCIVDQGRTPRDVLLAALLAEGVPVGVHFPRLMPRHPVFNEGREDCGSYPNALSFSSRHLVLPIYPALQGPEMMEIGNVVSDVLGSLELSDPNANAAAREFLAKSRLTELSSGLYMYLAKRDGGTVEAGRRA